MKQIQKIAHMFFERYVERPYLSKLFFEQVVTNFEKGGVHLSGVTTKAYGNVTQNNLFLPQNEYSKSLIKDSLSSNRTTSKQLYVLIGPPGCGKSTVRNQLCATNTDCGVISRDDFIVERFKDTVEQYDNYDHLYHKCWILSTKDKQTDKDFKVHCEHIINTHHTIIVDMTCLTVHTRKKWVDLANEYNCYVTMVVFERTLQQCIDAQTNRDKQIDSTIVTDMYNRMEFPLYGIECDHIELIPFYEKLDVDISIITS